MSYPRQGAKLGAPTSSRLSFEATKLPLGAGFAPQAPEPEAPGKSFMQTEFWSRFKSATGWTAYRLKASMPGSEFSDTIFTLARPLAFGQWFAYLPHGPALDAETAPLFPLRYPLGKGLSRIAQAL
jgi:hypothetical protein